MLCRLVQSTSTAARCCARSAAAAVPQPHSCNSSSHRCKSARMASATAFLPRIVVRERHRHKRSSSVLQQCNVSKPFVVTDKNLEALTRSVLDSADMSGEIYADEC